MNGSFNAHDAKVSRIAMAILNGQTRNVGIVADDAFTASIERIRYSEARSGANRMREDAFNAFLDRVDNATPREIVAFCDAMETFAPIVIVAR